MTSYLFCLLWGLIFWISCRRNDAAMAAGDTRTLALLRWWIPALLLGGFTLMIALSLRKHELSTDFGVYYEAAHNAFSNPHALVEGDYGFVNIPIVAWLFVPFLLVSKSIAFKLFCVLGLGVVAWAYVLARRTDDGIARAGYWALGPLVVSGAFAQSLLSGNLSHFVLLLLVAACFFVSRRRDLIAGALFAVCAVIKLPLLLVGIYLLARGRWKALIAYSVTGLVILGASVALYGIPLHLDWAGHVLKFVGRAVPAYNVQSVTGFLARLLMDTGPDPRNWRLYEVTPTFGLINKVLLLALLGSCVAVLWRAGRPRSTREFLLEISATLCLALLVSSLSWTHYYVMLWLPLAVLIACWKDGWLKPLDVKLLVAATVLMSLPSVVDPPSFGWAWLTAFYQKVWLSHTFYGGVLAFALLLKVRLSAPRAD